MSAIQKVFDNQDLKNIIFKFYSLRCKSCKTIMNGKYVNSYIHKYWDENWKKTENKYCKGYCNWCCIYVFEHLH